jgi:O-antigen/teichoic acid export membrane protein
MIMIAANCAGILANAVLLFSGWGVKSIPLSWLVRSSVLALGCGVAIWQVWSGLGLGKARGSTDRFFELLRLSAFTATSRAGYVLQSSADAFLAGVALGPVFAAKLVLTGRLIETLRTFPERFGSAAQPSLAHLFGQVNQERSAQLTLRFLRSGSLLAAILVAVAVAVNKQTVTAWVGPESFAGYKLTCALGVAAWVMTVSNLGNQVLIAHGEIEKPARAFFAYGIVKLALAALAVHWLGLMTFPLAAIAAAALTYGRQVFAMIAGVLRLKGAGLRLPMELMCPFAVCLSIAVAHWWIQPRFGRGWGAVSMGSVAVLLFMICGAGLLARQQAQELRAALAQITVSFCTCLKRPGSRADASSNEKQ